MMLQPRHPGMSKAALQEFGSSPSSSQVAVTLPSPAVKLLTPSGTVDKDELQDK